MLDTGVCGNAFKIKFDNSGSETTAVGGTLFLMGDICEEFNSRFSARDVLGKNSLKRFDD